jgi:hypothetical protein
MKVEKYLTKLFRYKDKNISIKGNRSKNSATITFGKDTIERKQAVSFSCFKKYIVFESLVMKKINIQGIGYHQILQKMWQRNNSVDLVGFCINEKGNLVGQITQLLDFLDYDEFEFYILSLAREADRFEYILTGADVY